ncbi:hypothetical protein ACTFIZ_000139 [Dictyostelium cf. discoideum]
MTGEMDYLLKVLVTDMAHFARFMREQVLKHPAVIDVKSSFVMEQIKQNTVLPFLKYYYANQALLSAAKKLPSVAVHDLYQTYPDFDIDIVAEQKALSQAKHIILQYPLYWYGPPAMLKQWLEQVLSYGWAYGSTNATFSKIADLYLNNGFPSVFKMR